MGVADRHSKRAAAEKGKSSSSILLDDRELDDPFSAWDDDDAGALKAATSPRPVTATSSSAQTRIERRGVVTVAAPPPSPRRTPAPPAIVADGSSRRPTPLSDALLDPVAMRDIVISRARTLDDPATTRELAEIARDLARRAPDRIAARSPERPARTTAPDIAMPRRRAACRPPLARDEPFRKK